MTAAAARGSRGLLLLLGDLLAQRLHVLLDPLAVLLVPSLRQLPLGVGQPVSQLPQQTCRAGRVRQEDTHPGKPGVEVVADVDVLTGGQPERQVGVGVQPPCGITGFLYFSAHTHSFLHPDVPLTLSAVSTNNIEFFNRLLPETRDAMKLEHMYEREFAENPSYVHLYRKGHAYHGAHPFYMWYWGETAASMWGR